MMTIPMTIKPNPRKPNGIELSFLMFIHGMLSGAILAAFATAEASYAMHLFAGAAALAALPVRVAAGLLVLPGTPLSLGFGWKGAPLSKVIKEAMPVSLLAAIGAASFPGWMIFDFGAGDDLHEGLASFAAILILTHVLTHVLLALAPHTIKKISSKVA